jgi:SAM-dependent methyltransferase
MPMSSATCRSCAAPLVHSFVDLGMSPLCESFLRADQLNSMEPFYPLHAYVCDQCWLVQLHEYVSGEAIFSDYAYFSSYSDSWVKHAQRYMDAMISRFSLGRTSLVFEVASNDGYLLQHAVAAKIPCLGIEPAANIAKVAVERGIPTVVHFLGRDTARAIVAEHGRADLVAANNVFAHVPDLNDFTAGLATLLAPTGVLTIEVPHLVKLVSENQFDTIYHEHFCYHSLVAAERVFERHGLVVFDVEELPTHGGSLRYFVRHAADESKPVEARVKTLRDRERALGVETLAYYKDFTAKVEETKRQLLTFLIEARRAGARVVGYGAPGKGNTLLNYCGIRTDLLEYTVDRSPHKQGMFLPGTHIPIHHPDRIREDKPDYVLFLPWNLKDELASQLAYVREWGGKFVVPIPETTVLP